jgi:ATP:ADP antiporter, AAA family
MIARTIGYGKLTRFYPVLEDYMKDPNPAVAKQAILSAGSSQDQGFVKILLSFLPNKSTRSAAKKALSRYEPSELLPILEDVSHASETKTDLLIQLPSLAESMETQQAVDYLFALVQHDDSIVKMEALESLHMIKARFPHLTIGWKRLIPIINEDVERYKDTLVLSYTSQHNLKRYQDDPKVSQALNELIELLERRRSNILEHIFWVIGLAYPPNAILPLFLELHDEDPAIRMNTVELLDNILEPALKKIVIPIIETAALETMSDEVMTMLDLKILTKLSSFERLLKGDDDLVKLAVLSLIEAIAKEKYTPLLHLAAKDDHPKISILAKKILANT